MAIIKLTLFLIILQICICYSSTNEDGELLSRKPDCKNGFCSQRPKRYILYEVTSGEGFNLRRDIYIRIAPLIKSLNQKDLNHEWILVLPPWGRLPHWRNILDSSKFFNWKTFFDVDKIREYIPVMELDEYLEEYGLDNQIDVVYQLQHFPFDEPQLITGWKEQIETGVHCQDKFGYQLDGKFGYYTGYFWKQKILAKEASCMALRGQASTLKQFLLDSDAKSIMFDRAEVILWDHYGGKEWWKARMSLRFANHLTQTAKTFLIDEQLSSSQNSSDLSKSREYIGVHLRRRDFLYGRKKDIPSLVGAAKQILQICGQLSLTDVFIATDADQKEIDELQKEILKYSQQQQIKLHQYPCQSLSDGECAIVDQILCSFSSHFMGTRDSTFTYRIYEEREILGFEPDQTYNNFCPDDPVENPCKKPTQWRIPLGTNVY